MPGTTSAALPSFSHDQLHETDAAKWKGGGFLQTRCPFHHLNKSAKAVKRDMPAYLTLRQSIQIQYSI